MIPPMRTTFLYIVAILALLTITGSCSSSSDKFDDIDNIVDSKPDSALVLLDSLRPDSTSSKETRAHFQYLYHYARYKCGYQDTEDSLIQQTADYYLRTDNHARSAMSLFLLGYIQKNNNHLGDAAISFTQGAEIGRQHNEPFPEALCQRGLAQIYGSLFDSKKTIIHAREAFDAFKKLGTDYWNNCAAYELIVAYSNDHQYKAALDMSIKLSNHCKRQNDIEIAANSLAVAGLCSNILGDYLKSVGYYYEAYSLLGDLPEIHDWQNLFNSLSHVPQGEISESIRKQIESQSPLTNRTFPFEVLYERGEYQKAYNALWHFSAEQDSVLAAIRKQDVNSSLYHYAQNIETVRAEQQRRRLIFWLCVAGLCIIIIAYAFFVFRRRLVRQQIYQDDLLNLTDELNSDLNRQRRHNAELSAAVKELFAQKFNEIDNIYMKYYEPHETPGQKKKLVADIESYIKNLGKDPANLAELEKFINRYADNLIERLKSEIPNLQDDEIKFYVYNVVGFSSRSISVILDEKKIENIYNRKSRLKSKISNSNAEHKAEFLEAFLHK